MKKLLIICLLALNYNLAAAKTKGEWVSCYKENCKEKASCDNKADAKAKCLDWIAEKDRFWIADSDC